MLTSKPFANNTFCNDKQYNYYALCINIFITIVPFLQIQLLVPPVFLHCFFFYNLLVRVNNHSVGCFPGNFNAIEIIRSNTFLAMSIIRHFNTQIFETTVNTKSRSLETMKMNFGNLLLVFLKRFKSYYYKNYWNILLFYLCHTTWIIVRPTKLKERIILQSISYENCGYKFLYISINHNYTNHMTKIKNKKIKILNFILLFFNQLFFGITNK